MKKCDRNERGLLFTFSTPVLTHNLVVENLCMPGPVYNWFCVAHSIVDVLSKAAAIRASQVYPHAPSAVVQRNLKRKTTRPIDPKDEEPELRDPSYALGDAGGVHIGRFKTHTLACRTHPIL